MHLQLVGTKAQLNVGEIKSSVAGYNDGVMQLVRRLALLQWAVEQLHGNVKEFCKVRNAGAARGWLPHCAIVLLSVHHQLRRHNYIHLARITPWPARAVPVKRESCHTLHAFPARGLVCRLATCTCRAMSHGAKPWSRSSTGMMCRYAYTTCSVACNLCTTMYLGTTMYLHYNVPALQCTHYLHSIHLAVRTTG